MGLSFSYRWMLSFPLLGMALWPFFSSARIHLTYTILFSWSISCLLLGAFTFMPVVGKDAFIELVVLAGLIWGVGFATFTSKILVRLYKRGLESKREILLSILQILLLGICLENVFVQSKRFENKSPVSYAYQTIAWVIALLSLVLPLLHSNRLLCRILAIDTSILTLYLLLSVSHEGLFLLTLIFNTICWILIEFKLAHSNKARIIDFTFGTEDGESLAKSQGISAIERSNLSRHMSSTCRRDVALCSATSHATIQRHLRVAEQVPCFGSRDRTSCDIGLATAVAECGRVRDF
ncbi:unnamed protein product [Plutella xylostella]|uniref:GPI ethanolamine phosphate transferase 1 n=1 Tax=Plutella xylostella TaxID=51655 RepID=A0A8S4EP10_PLUXY|nr:unnamed protein product [Plutella xylostella]